MRQQRRHICLLLDNFSGHYVDYRPQNIHLEYFEPNLTSHVQPCDAGIIRTTKALYRNAFCLRAVDLDDAGQRDIYKIDLREAMLMMVKAWNQVKPSTIVNCWNHSGIQPNTEIDLGKASTTSTIFTNSHPTTSRSSSTCNPKQNPATWILVREFAMLDDIRLPTIEKQLSETLGAAYTASDWDPVLKVIMDAENDMEKALTDIDQLVIPIFGCPIRQISISSQALATTQTAMPRDLPQLAEVEKSLQAAVDDLQKRKRIIGKALTLEEMLNPVEETGIGESAYEFAGGDDEIVAHVKHALAMKQGEVIEAEDKELIEDEEPEIKLSEAIGLCEKMERISIAYGTSEEALNLSEKLRKFRVELRQMERAMLKQTTLDMYIRKALQ